MGTSTPNMQGLARSVARLAVAVATADRRITPQEVVSLGRLDTLGLGSLADPVRNELELAAHDPIDVEATCAALPPLNGHGSALLLTVLADIARCDGTLAAQERDMFVHIAGRLGVGPEVAARILDGGHGDGAAARRTDPATPAVHGNGLPPGSDETRRAFAMLGLLPGANRGKIDAAYLELVQRYEPTRVGQLGAGLRGAGDSPPGGHHRRLRRGRRHHAVKHRVGTQEDLGMNDTTMFTDVARRLECDEERAERTVMAVLQELRDRLPEKEAGDLQAQLPTSFRRLWFQPGRAGRPIEKTHRADLVARVRARVPLRDDAEAERAVLAVFGEIQRILRSARGVDGEAWDVFSVLPKDLKTMWLDARAST